MAERKVLVQKCKEMGIQFSTKTRVSVLKEKLRELGVDLTSITNTTPTAAVDPRGTQVNLSGQQLEAVVNSVVEKLSTKRKSRRVASIDMDDEASATASFEDDDELEGDDDDDSIIKTVHP